MNYNSGRLYKSENVNLNRFAYTNAAFSFLALLASLAHAALYHNNFGADGLWVPSWGFDFFDYYSRYLFRHTSTFFTYPSYPWYYPAAAIFLHAPYYGVAHRTGNLILAYYLYIATIGVVASLGSWFLWRALRGFGISAVQAIRTCSILFLASWPLYFAAQRGNIEGVMWTFVGLAVWAYVEGRYSLSSVLIGLAGAAKIYPLLFAALFLHRKRSAMIWWTGLTFVVTSLIAIFYLDPHLAQSTKYVVTGIQHWTRDYSETYRDPEWDHSLFGLTKDIWHNQIHSYRHTLLLYYVWAGLSATIAYLTRIRKLPRANQIVFLSCAAITLPPTSFDYTLCLLYVPIAYLLLVAAQPQSESDSSNSLGIHLTLLGLAVSPTTFMFTEAHPELPGACKAVVLLSLMIVTTIFPLPDCLGQTTAPLIDSKAQPA